MDLIQLTPSVSLSLDDMLKQIPSLSSEQSANVMDHVVKLLLKQNSSYTAKEPSQSLSKAREILLRLPQFNSNTLLIVTWMFDSLQQDNKDEIIQFLQQLHKSHFGVQVH